jgi:hypothetical protein
LPIPAFRQDSGPDGIVSIDAEHYQGLVEQGGHTWMSATPAGHSAGSSLVSAPNVGSNMNTGYATGSPRLDYGVNFVKTGTHYLWIRGIGPTGNDDSCHAGLDGAAVPTATRISSFFPTWTWSRSTMDGTTATLGVGSPGLHTVNVWMREDGMIIDKILLTTNGSYVPTGAGPAESGH